MTRLNKFVIFSLLVLLGYSSTVLGYKILLVFPLASKSHFYLGNELGKGLARAGNDVTMVSIYTEPKPPKNYKQILVPELETLFGNNDNEKSQINMFEKENSSPFSHLLFASTALGVFIDKFFNLSKVQDLLKSNEHFDAVIIDQFFTDSLQALAYHFDAHLILLDTTAPNRWTTNLIASPRPPSYVSDTTLPFNGDMNFYERTYNLIFSLFTDFYLYSYIYPHHNTLVQKYFPNAPDLIKIQANVSLVLTNSHESLTDPIPHVPNLIDIGGYHVNPPKELPKHLQELMDSAKDGVIYFSMGSFLVPSQIPKEKKEAILKVLGSRREKVLWKWNEDNLENKPDNVLIEKWFPQQAILAHPNCKLFITHGGLLSTIETISLGVPILAFPIFGDQKLNAIRAASLGYGKFLYFNQINEKTVNEAINELIENPSYRENVKKRSRIIHDRPMKPIDLAIFWIEYVIRHKGATHLRVAAINLPLYKYYMLDVIGVILAVPILIIYLLTRLCRRKKTTKSKRE